MNNKLGFVYLWFDRKRKKFCIGSHIGSLDDGYVTSTGYMMHAYKRRPYDFRRRILWQATLFDYRVLHEEEQRWLDMIKPDELGIKYYNHKRSALGGNGHANKGKQTWMKGKKHSAESNAKNSLSHQGQIPGNKGMTWSAEIRQRISEGTRANALRGAACKMSKRWTLLTPEGTQIVVEGGFSKFCRIRGLGLSKLLQTMKTKQPVDVGSAKGWMILSAEQIHSVGVMS